MELQDKELKILNLVYVKAKIIFEDGSLLHHPPFGLDKTEYLQILESLREKGYLKCKKIEKSGEYSSDLNEWTISENGESILSDPSVSLHLKNILKDHINEERLGALKLIDEVDIVTRNDYDFDEWYFEYKDYSEDFFGSFGLAGMTEEEIIGIFYGLL